MPNRTDSGSPSQAARDKYGNDRGAFPIFDQRSAVAALKLRGRAKDKAERRDILRRAAKYAPQAAKEAYQADKEAGAI